MVELFAGVGGFRFGLNEVAQATEDGRGTPGFEVVFANQWEPGKKAQHAAAVYAERWGGADLINRDIFEVLEDPVQVARLGELAPDMLVGGFPCQDYSVAKPLSRSAGLEGKKGVLWWAMHRLLQLQSEAGKPIRYVMLENVDRLISSPSTCRGRDFAVILASLQALGYAVEWRVINAADYGFPQRRRRTFIQAYHYSTAIGQRLLAASTTVTGAQAWLETDGPMAQALPVKLKPGATPQGLSLPMDVWTAQSTYTPNGGRSSFALSGVAAAGMVWTAPTVAKPTNPAAAGSEVAAGTQPRTLGDITAATTNVPDEFFIEPEALKQWRYLKGAKSVPRTSKSGHRYEYSEGAVAFPDPLNAPSRTIITAEGNAGASRTTHVVQHADGRLRRLTPEELEQLIGLPRGFTDVGNLSPRQRAFLMGNALVVGLVTALGQALLAQHGAASPDKSRELADTAVGYEPVGTAKAEMEPLARVTLAQHPCESLSAPEPIAPALGLTLQARPCSPPR